MGAKLNNERMVLSAFVKENKDDKAKLENVARCLTPLRDYMVSEKLKTINLTKTGDGLDHIPWITLEQALKRQAESGNFVYGLHRYSAGARLRRTSRDNNRGS